MKTKQIIGLIAISVLVVACRQTASENIQGVQDVSSQVGNKSTLSDEECQRALAEEDRIRQNIIQQGITLNNATTYSVIDPTMSSLAGRSQPEAAQIIIAYLKKHEPLLPAKVPSSEEIKNLQLTLGDRKTPESRLVLTVKCLMESKSIEAHQAARDFIARFNEKYGDSDYGKFMNQRLKQAREDGVGMRQQSAIMEKYYKREIDAQQMRELVDKIDITKED